MIGKIDKESAVLGTQHLIQKCAQIFLVRFHEGGLAAADVHHQAEVQRDIHAAGKEGDLLRNAVLQDLEIVLCQIGV